MSNTTVKKQITVSEVQGMLNEGMNREAIRIHFGLKKSELTRMFKNNPNLKGKKVKRTGGNDSFVLIDDVTPTTGSTTPTSASETAPETPTAASESTPEATEEAAY